MSKLYEIANEYAKLMDSDLEPEMIADTIEGMEGEFTDKIEQLLSVIKNESGYAERLKEEAKSLNERAAVIQNKIDSIKSYIASSLEMVGKKKIRAGIHQVTIRKPSETVEIIDSSALPPEYVEFETTIKADKLAIKHQLKAGINIPGAQLKVGKQTPWEKWEVDFLREVAATMPVEVIAEKLERTEKAVMAKATRIGADIVSRLRGRRWTRAEVSLFGKFSAEEIAIATCRSIYSVRAMRYKLKKLDEERAGIRIN